MSKAKIDWLKAEQDYLNNNELSLMDISQRYGISHSRVKKVSMDKGWHQKRQRLIEKSKKRIEKEAEKSFKEQIIQHRKDVEYVKTVALSEIRKRAEKGLLKNESLSALVRMIDISLREAREMLPKRLFIEETELEEDEGHSPELLEAIDDVFVFKLTRGRNHPSIHFDKARKQRWKKNIEGYKKYKKECGVNIENKPGNC